MAVDTAQHGCTFYIAGEGDMLRLDDIHVEDHNTGEWRRPVCSGEMPLQAGLYQQVLGSCLLALSRVRARHLHSLPTHSSTQQHFAARMAILATVVLQVPWVKEKHGDYMKMKDDVSEVKLYCSEARTRGVSWPVLQNKVLCAAATASELSSC